MRRRLALAALALLVAGSGVGVALALASPGSPPTQVRTTTVPVFGFAPVYELPRCVRIARLHSAEHVGGPAPARLAARLGLLRRPATPADALSDDALALLQRLPMAGVHVDAARRLPDAPGTKERWVIPVTDVLPAPRLNRRCLADLGPKRRASVLARYRRLRAAPADPGLLVLTRGGESAFGLVSLSRIDRAGGFAEQPCLGPRGELHGLDGFLPDGVTEVHAALSDGRRVDATVQENTVRIVLTQADRRALREIVFRDPGGQVERHVSFRRAGSYAGVCGPTPRVAAGVALPMPLPSPQDGVVELRTLDAFAMDAPALQAVTRAPLPGARCLAVGTPLPRTDPAAPGIVPDTATQQCATTRHVRARSFVGGLARRDDGTIVLSGFAAPQVRWVQAVGFERNRSIAVRPGRSGAVFVGFGRPRPHGVTLRVRAAIRANPTVYGPWRVLRLPRGQAHGAYAMPEGVRPFGVFARPRTLGDVYPLAFGVPERRGENRLVAGRADLRGARRAAGTDAWLIPGARDVCVAIRPALGRSMMGCAPLATAATGRRPPGSRAYDGTWLHLLPDGIRDLRVARADGTTAPVAFRDNLARVRTRGVARPVVLRWTLPDGSPGRFTYPRPR